MLTCAAVSAQEFEHHIKLLNARAAIPLRYMALLFFRAVACAWAVSSVRALNLATRTAGDAQPHQYPVLNVHVTEPLPTRASMDNDAMTQLQQQQMDVLNALDARLVASEQTLSSAVRGISTKVDAVANLLASL